MFRSPVAAVARVAASGRAAVLSTAILGEADRWLLGVAGLPRPVSQPAPAAYCDFERDSWPSRTKTSCIARPIRGKTIITAALLRLVLG